MDIRIWLRDQYPQYNTLLDDFEFGKEEIRTAMTLAVDAWNEQPPPVDSHTLYNFPYRHALLKGTTANLMFIAANLYRRNKLQYNISGGAIADQAKDVDYDNAGNRLWQEYISWVVRKKRSINVQRGWTMI